jgi:hypothetical protein
MMYPADVRMVRIKSYFLNSSWNHEQIFSWAKTDGAVVAMIHYCGDFDRVESFRSKILKSFLCEWLLTTEPSRSVSEEFSMHLKIG